MDLLSDSELCISLCVSQQKRATVVICQLFLRVCLETQSATNTATATLSAFVCPIFFFFFYPRHNHNTAPLATLTHAHTVQLAISEICGFGLDSV